MASTQSSPEHQSCDQDASITSTSEQAVTKSTIENDQNKPSSDTPSASGQSAMQSPPLCIENDQSNPSDTPSTSGQSAVQSLPLCIENDQSNPSDTPSTSGQSAVQSHPSSIEHDFSNISPDSPSTSGQIIRRPPPSSIEVDPDNPESPPPKESTDKVQFTKSKRAVFQLPIWKQHFKDLWIPIGFAVFLVLVSPVFIVLAYIMEPKVAYLGGAFVANAVTFSLIWLATPEGPPFLSEVDGKPIKPSYLKTERLKDEEYNLASPEAELLRALMQCDH